MNNDHQSNNTKNTEPANSNAFNGNLDSANAAPAGPAPVNTDEIINDRTAQTDPYTQPESAYSAEQWQNQNPYAAGSQQYQAPPYYYAYPAQPRRVRECSTNRDMIMALLIAVMSFVTVDCFWWSGTLGLGFSCGMLLLLGTVLWYMNPYWRQKSFYSSACVLLFASGSVSFVFSADSGTKALTLLCMIILYSCILMDRMKLRSWTAGTLRSVGDFFYTLFSTGFGRIAQGTYGLFHWKRDEKSKRMGSVGKALLGLVIALPVILIVLGLLSKADLAFNGMLNSIDLDSFPKKLLTLVLSVPVFLILFSQLFSLNSIERKEKQENGKGFDPVVLTFFLIGISLVYVAYLFSQLAYFFSGFMGFLPAEFTYAEYARRGFFELTAVGVINILTVIIATALSRKTDGKLPVGVKLTSIFLCLFSLVLVFTEVAKMKMYMDNFGLTRLRILTTVFMIFLAVVFIALIIHVFALKFPYLKAAVTVGAILTLTVSFISVDRLVAEYNVWAYQSGALATVDVDTITELGDAAVPSLIKLARDNNSNVSDKAKLELKHRWQNMHEFGDWDASEHTYRTGELEPYDFRGYNTVSYQARQLLLENEELFNTSRK